MAKNPVNFVFGKILPTSSDTDYFLTLATIICQLNKGSDRLPN
jgi:hypothetical protein